MGELSMWVPSGFTFHSMCADFYELCTSRFFLGSFFLGSCQARVANADSQGIAMSQRRYRGNVKGKLSGTRFVFSFWHAVVQVCQEPTACHDHRWLFSGRGFST